MKSSLVGLPPEILYEIIGHVSEDKFALPSSYKSVVTEDGGGPLPVMTVEHPILSLRRCVASVF